MDVNAYLSAIWTIVLQVEYLRPIQHARVTTWVNAARAVGVPEWKIGEFVLKPWNAWDQAVATLVNVTIPLEMKRVQDGGAIGNKANFQPPPAPSLPPIPTSATDPVTAPPTSPPVTGPGTQPPATTTPPPTTTPAPGTIAGVPVKTLAIAGGVILAVLMLSKR